MVFIFSSANMVTLSSPARNLMIRVSWQQGHIAFHIVEDSSFCKFLLVQFSFQENEHGRYAP